MKCAHCKKRIWPWQKDYWVDERDVVIHSHCVQHVYILTLKPRTLEERKELLRNYDFTGNS